MAITGIGKITEKIGSAETLDQNKLYGKLNDIINKTS